MTRAGTYLHLRHPPTPHWKQAQQVTDAVRVLQGHSLRSCASNLLFTDEKSACVDVFRRASASLPARLPPDHSANTRLNKNTDSSAVLIVAGAKPELMLTFH